MVKKYRIIQNWPIQQTNRTKQLVLELVARSSKTNYSSSLTQSEKIKLDRVKPD
ncbi:hypothetical protein [Pedobacter sp. UC225_65]|uniref:hypothetical protein n=1 Tax=Pedobacter sp. UC225_65 TaxID=3350173 RepID=UPI003670CED5